MEVKRYEFIDCLRGIAVILVIITHVQYLLGVEHNLPYLPQEGRLGVSLFFMVSAFTLMLSQQKRQYEEHSLRNFYVRRFFRIAPMYYLAIVFFSFSYFLGFDFQNLQWSNISIKELATNLLFINGFFPQYIHHYVPGGWSIAVEFMFYAIFPTIFLLVKNLRSALFFALATLVISFAADLILKNMIDDENFRKLYILAQLPVFSLGILAYHFVNEESEFKKKIYVFYYLIAGIILYCVLFQSFEFGYNLLLLSLLLFLCYKPFLLLNNKILAWVGKLSFSLYLVHFAVLALFNKYLLLENISEIIPDPKLVWCFSALCLFLVSIVISNFTYNFIEIPGQNLGRKLLKKVS